jgi:hypothetical protein
MNKFKIKAKRLVEDDTARKVADVLPLLAFATLAPAALIVLGYLLYHLIPH